jgi:hypothetical protein
MGIILEFDLHLNLVRGTKSTPHALIGGILFYRVVGPAASALRGT